MFIGCFDEYPLSPPSPVAALELELSDPRAYGMGVAVATDIGFICAVQYGSC